MVAMDALLASLEAEAVGYIDAEYAEFLRSGHIESCSVYAEQGEGGITPYTAPPAPLEIADLHRKAAIHDALCEKYGVESLSDFVEWQRNHIAELEAAPPAPVGEGEAAVMPEYPGYVMTQRECFEAGKKAGLAEAGNSPVVPDGLCPCCGRKPLKNKTCSVAGCDGKHVARGFCAMHYAIERKKDPSRLESIRAADKRYRARKAATPRQEVK